MLREIAEDEERGEHEEEGEHEFIKLLAEGIRDGQAIDDQEETQIRMLSVVVEEEEGRQHDHEGANIGKAPSPVHHPEFRSSVTKYEVFN